MLYDVANRYVTRDAAREDYGVVVKEDLTAVDIAATQALRAKLKVAVKTSRPEGQAA